MLLSERSDGAIPVRWHMQVDMQLNDLSVQVLYLVCRAVRALACAARAHPGAPNGPSGDMVTGNLFLSGHFGVPAGSFGSLTEAFKLMKLDAVWSCLVHVGPSWS